MKNLIPTTTYYYHYFKHDKIDLGGFKKLAHKFTQVQVMEVVSAPMSLQIQVHMLNCFTMLEPRISQPSLCHPSNTY